MQRPKAPELVVGLAAAALLVGAAVGLTNSTAPTEAAGPTAVEIAGFAFGPDALTVKVGDTVTWANSDGATHTVTGKEGDTLKSEDLKTDATYEVTFDEAGTFEYMCKFHPNMQGTITVEG